MSPKRSTFSEPLRYFLVVAFGYGADFGVYSALVAAGASIYLANLAGFCLGACLNVVLIRRYVFPDSRFRLGADVVLTIAANGAMLAIGTLLLWVLVEAAGTGPYWGKLIANAVTFALNYMTRVVFFRKA